MLASLVRYSLLGVDRSRLKSFTKCERSLNATLTVYLAEESALKQSVVEKMRLFHNNEICGWFIALLPPPGHFTAICTAQFVDREFLCDNEAQFTPFQLPIYRRNDRT